MPGDENTLPSSTRALLEAVTAISSDLDLHSVLERIVTAATELTGARYGALGVIGNDDLLVEFVTTGLTAQEREQIGELPHGHGILGLLIHHPEPIRLDDLTQHPSRPASRRTTRRWARSSAYPSGSAAPSSATST